MNHDNFKNDTPREVQVIVSIMFGCLDILADFQLLRSSIAQKLLRCDMTMIADRPREKRTKLFSQMNSSKLALSWC